jgi:hypothetical protein
MFFLCFFWCDGIGHSQTQTKQSKCCVSPCDLRAKPTSHCTQHGSAKTQSPLPLSGDFFVLESRLQVIPNGKLLVELFLHRTRSIFRAPNVASSFLKRDSGDGDIRSISTDPAQRSEPCQHNTLVDSTQSNPTHLACQLRSLHSIVRSCSRQ